MTSRDFAYWLQGFFEIALVDSTNPTISAKQTDLIRKHLALVFKHEIDPSMGDDAHQVELNAIHQNIPGADATPHNFDPSKLTNPPRMRC